MSEIIDIDVFKIEDPPIIQHTVADYDHLHELAESIKQIGLLQPITVRKKEDHYQLINGYNRVMAAKKYGIPKLPARVLQMDDKNALLAISTENIMRSAHNPMQEGKLYKELVEKHNLSTSEIAKKFGRSKSYVDNKIKLLGVPDEYHDYIESKALTQGAALELLRLEADEDKMIVASEFIRDPACQPNAHHFVTAYIEAKRSNRLAPPQEILTDAKEAPVGKCDICNDLKKYGEISGKGICESCERHIHYLLEKERKETLLSKRPIGEDTQDTGENDNSSVSTPTDKDLPPPT